MDPLFAAGTALVISLALIPLMLRLAPQFGLLDKPNERKVHVIPVPRVGGWGIAGGALIAILLWQPAGTLSHAFIFGGLVLVVAGAVDDARDLLGRTKLALQFLAVAPIVFYAGLTVDVLPMAYDIHLPTWVAALLSILGLMVCINGTNTSDGLDGLAAGATLLSLFGILYVAVTTDTNDILLMAAAALGGLIGFLRYNTHPAVLFMGDLGSQFLGFVVGFLALALLQSAPDQFSPWAIPLLIGLPTADIAVVALRRLQARVSLFRPDKTHIHHRLMDLGFSHSQAVTTIYTLQGSFVFFGVALRASDPWKIVLVYSLHLAVIYGFLYLAETRQNDNLKIKDGSAQRDGGDHAARPALLWAPRVFLETLVPLVLVTGALVAVKVPTDFGVLGVALLAILLARLFIKPMQSTAGTRIPLFITATAVLYVYCNYPPFESQASRLPEIVVIGTIAIMAFVAVRFSPKRRREEFRPNGMDYLLAVFAVLAVIALRTTQSAFNPYFLVYLPAVLYACEIILIERRQRTDWLPPATLVAASILAIRGLLLGG